MASPFNYPTWTSRKPPAWRIYAQAAKPPDAGADPLKLARILDAAETGDMTAQFELFEDMEEKDGHIAVNEQAPPCLHSGHLAGCPPEKSPTPLETRNAANWMNCCKVAGF